MFWEFDFAEAFEELTIIWDFSKIFKPSIQAEMELCGWKLGSFEELVRKTKNVKTKPPLWCYSCICETYQYYFQKSWFKKKAKDQTNWKDLRAKKLKAKSQLLIIWSDEAIQKAKKRLKKTLLHLRSRAKSSKKCYTSYWN